MSENDQPRPRDVVVNPGPAQLGVAPADTRGAEDTAVSPTVLRNARRSNIRLAWLIRSFPQQARKHLHEQTAPKRQLTWMFEITNRINDSMVGSCACAVGCHHCCRLALTISSEEAKRIGQALGIQPTTPHQITPEEVDQQRSEYAGTACPFLQNDGRCGVYHVRPVACRLNFNIGDNPDACRHNSGQKVVNIDFTAVRQVYVALMGSDAVYNDIRKFFPERQLIAKSV